MLLRGWLVGVAMLLTGAAAGAQDVVGKAATAVRLFDDSLQPVATVPAGPAWDGRPILAASHPESTQFVKIRYDGPAVEGAVPGKAYWVRRTSVMPRSTCTMTAVAPGERDTRAGPNGAGSFCPGTKP